MRSLVLSSFFSVREFFIQMESYKEYNTNSYEVQSKKEKKLPWLRVVVVAAERCLELKPWAPATP